MGSLSVLNVGKGDIQITFNQHDVDERERAKQMLADMRARGYAILLRLEDGTYTRAIDFDAEQGTYVVRLPETAPLPPGAVDESSLERRAEQLAEGRARKGTGRKKKRAGALRRVRVPMERAEATGVARSAGG